MANQQGANSYAVDLVMCIDGTGSMSDIINRVKKQAKEFYGNYLAAMEKGGKKIRDNWFRVKVIVFRDYGDSEGPAMQESGFFDLTNPDGRGAFERFVDGIEAIGGGDDPENALEAIFQALKSDWGQEGGRFRRHCIILFTDAPALPLQEKNRVSNVEYPVDAPADLNGLIKILTVGDGGQSKTFKKYSTQNGRLIVFAPKGCGWDWVKSVPMSFLIPTRMGGGCEEIPLQEAMNVLVSSYAVDSDFPTVSPEDEDSDFIFGDEEDGDPNLFDL